MAWIESHRAKDGQVYRYVVWRDPRTRARRKRPLGAVPLEAARAEADQATRREERRTPPPVAFGAIQALDRFLAHRREVLRLRPETIRYYDRLLRPLFVELAAKGPMRAWESRWLEAYVAARPRWSPRYVQMLLVSCRTFARWARRSSVACAPFAADVRGPTVRAPSRRAYSASEVRDLLRAVEGRNLAAAVALAALAGLSLGDLRALTWGQVDLAAGVIRGERSKGGRAFAIPIAATLAAVLRAAGPGAPDAPVCPLPASDSSAYKAWARLCRRAGVDPTGGFKRLRHTYATLLDAAHVDTGTRRDLMAHAPGSSTIGRYTHSDVERMRAAIGRLDAAVRR